ncbi:MAG TPA: hypothetical protein VE338_06880 [Ktedonobacterales bacterium]|jgi:hypothetical protein|nr:hypothetical protein [Ktedonobacterales bacterium]
MERSHYVGVDLGQAHDPTAICVVDRCAELLGVDAATREPLLEVWYELRFLERVALGTPYPDVVARVRSIAERLTPRPELVVDGTGVGRPVVDLLRGGEYLLHPVAIVSGGKARASEGWWHVPKRDLVAGLVVLFQRGELRIAASLRDADALANELLNFRVKVSNSGNESYGNWRDADHDDLVLAVALACWRAARSLPGQLAGVRALPMISL